MDKKYIVIAPFAQKLRNGKNNAKNYPYWEELIKLFEKDYEVIQVGVVGEKQFTSNVVFNSSLDNLKQLLKDSVLWISVDSFLPHLAHHVGKRGVVIWGPSNPEIFGYAENLNIIKDKKYFKKNQFGIWEEETFNPDVFLSAEEIYSIVKKDFVL